VCVCVQIMTGDDWSNQMYMAVNATGSKLAILYFEAIIIFGNCVCDV